MLQVGSISSRPLFPGRPPALQPGSYMFYALEPSSQYEVVIQSENQWGWSQNSNPYFFSTRATGERKARKKKVIVRHPFLALALSLDA